MLEMEKRNKNIMKRGIRTVRRGHKEEVKEIIKKCLGIDTYIKAIRAIGGEIVGRIVRAKEQGGSNEKERKSERIRDICRGQFDRKRETNAGMALAHGESANSRGLQCKNR